MNLIFMKTKAISVDLFTNDSAAYEYAKPDLANRFHPEWWKRLPKTYFPDAFPSPTMKTCAGFIDLYKHGFMIPMWCDLFVRVESDGEFIWKYSDNKSIGICHRPQEAGDLFINSNVRNLKLNSPWLAVTKEDVHWLIHQPMWSQDLQRELIMPPAVVTFKHQHTTNINTLVADIYRPREFTVPFGLPMVHYIPVDNRPVKLHLHLVSAQEYEHILNKGAPRSFLNAYRKKIKAAQEARA